MYNNNKSIETLVSVSVRLFKKAVGGGVRTEGRKPDIRRADSGNAAIHWPPLISLQVETSH